MCADFLDKVYKTEYKDPRDLYRDWADTYDNELAHNEYTTPIRTAKALTKFVSNKSTSILDFGCGTGLSAEALISCGFSNIDGIDISNEMIEIAREKRIYRNLECFNPDKGIPVKKNQYFIITAIGVISVGAAPISIFDEVFDLLPKDGLFAFSFNEHSLMVPEYSLKVEQTVNEKSSATILRTRTAHFKTRFKVNGIYYQKVMTFITRFAPSPTGPMHLGHAYSAMLAYDISQENEGDFHLRIEDLDQSRAKIHWEEQIYEDLSWLGIKWNKTVLRQSERLDLYFTEMLRKAENFGLFICRCSRGDIASITSAPHGADGLVYPGTCRNGKHSFSTEMRKIQIYCKAIFACTQCSIKHFSIFKKIYFGRASQLSHFLNLKKYWRRCFMETRLCSLPFS